MNAIISRRLMFAILTVWVFAPRAPAQVAPSNSIDGVYNGTYISDQGTTTFKVTLTLTNATLKGVFTLYPLGGSGTKAHICDLVGNYSPTSRRFQMRVSKWETALPAGVGMMGMSGVFDPGGGAEGGQISGKMLARDEPAFEAARDAAESAKLADEIAAQEKAAAATSVTVTGSIPFQQGAPGRMHGVGN